MRYPEIATNDTAAKAFIDALSVICHMYIYDSEKLTLDLADLMTEATPFAIKHKIPKTLWSRIIKILNTRDFYDADDYFYDLAEAVRAVANSIKSDMTLTKGDVDFIKDSQLYLRTGSEPASNRIVTKVGSVASARVASLFVNDVESTAKDQQSLLKQVHSITKRLVGEELDVLPLDKAQVARAQHPELYKKYLAIRRDINTHTKQAISTICRTNGGPMDVKDLRDALTKRGILNSIPTGFVGKMDESGYYTVFGEKIEGAPVGDVAMNPAYTKGSTKYVFKTRAPGAKTWQTIYTKDAKGTSTEQKYAKTAEAIAQLEKARELWRRDLMGNDYDYGKPMGALVEMLYLTQARIGTEGNEAEGGSTYGLTTLLGEHYIFKGNKVFLKYRGKKGARQEHVIDASTDKWSKELVSYLADIWDDADNDEQMFGYSAREVNAYIKTRLKLNITAHKFRTIRGTLLMEELLEAAKKKLGENPTEKAILVEFNKAAEEVGAVLGHSNKTPDGGSKITGSTAIKSYISPAVMLEYFAHYGVRPPVAVERLATI